MFWQKQLMSTGASLVGTGVGARGLFSSGLPKVLTLTYQGT